MKKVKLGDVVFNTFNTVFMLLLVIVTLYPFANTVAVSFNEGMDSLREGSIFGHGSSRSKTTSTFL